MKLDTVLQIIKYNVGEVSEFGWKSLGLCRIWDFNNIKNEEVGSFVVNKSGDVLELDVCHTRDNGENICYRWIHECYRDDYLIEEEKNTAHFNDDEKTKFINLDEEEDCLEKLTAIVELKDFDSRIQVVINLSDFDFLQISQMAHKADITFNQQVNLILADVVEQEKKKKKDAEAGEGLRSNIYEPSNILEVQENEDGELFLQFTPEILEQADWSEGDTINFKENEDGSFLLTKVKN